ncbi:MAG: hypothetical protein ABEJ73_05700 [Haloplanus sp.]
MYRRALLSAGVTGATAGCLGPAFGFGSDCPRGASLRLRPVTDADTADAASGSLDTLAPPHRDTIVAAHHGDEPTIWLPESADAPFAGTDYVAVDDAYVTVSTSVVSSTERTGYEVRLDTDESTTPGRSVALADLPAVDRTGLYVSLGYNTFRKLDASEGAHAVSIGGTLAYPTDDAESRSVLVPDPEYDTVRIGGDPFRVRITGTTPTTVGTRRVDVRTVATAASEFAALVYDRFGVDLDERGLSTEQRDVVETAISDGYDECAPYSEAYADLQRTLGGTGQGDPRSRRVDYANYETEWYSVQVSEYVV